jgi:hypothetical protein
MTGEIRLDFGILKLQISRDGIGNRILPALHDRNGYALTRAGSAI